MSDRPIGIDISRYQHPVNWAKLALAKPAFVCNRATIGSLYRDPFFVDAIDNLKRLGIPYSAYHVVRPDYAAAEQALNFISTLKAAQSESTSIPLVLDCELNNGQSQSVIAQCIWNIVQILQDRYGKKPVIYSRKSWTDLYIGNRSWLNGYEWWMAFYPSSDWKLYTKTPAPPAGVDPLQVVLHQVSSNGDGLAMGMASKSVDVNFWLRGGVAGFAKYVQDYSGIAPAPVPTINDRVLRLEIEARKRSWQV